MLMGLATVVQLDEMKRVSYAPLADTLREIAPREARHVELGLNGLRQIVESDDGRAQAKGAIAYWMPKVDATFGQSASKRYDTQARFGLRHTENEKLRELWAQRVNDLLAPMGLA